MKILSRKAFILIIIILVIIAGVYLTMKSQNSGSSAGLARVTLETTEGNIVIELYRNMPITAGNFEKLVRQGFYDGVIFHRVIPDFMIQSGDPEGTGMGGPGYSIEDEFTGTSSDENNRGTIAMANSNRPNTGGSQFFINVADNNFLDGKHPVFGKVVEGMNVVDKISLVERDADDRPLKEVKIIKAEIL